MPGSSRRAGMTLVEMLVALAIVGVMATMVVLGLGLGSRGSDPKIEINRLADRLGLAVDEVLVTRRSIALSWDASSYGFMTMGADGRWTPDGDPNLGERYALPKGVTLKSDAPALLPIGADTASVPAQFSFSGSTTTWSLAFDGLNSTALPAGGA